MVLLYIEDHGGEGRRVKDSNTGSSWAFVGAMSAKNADLGPKMPDAGMILIGRESLTVGRKRVK